MNNLLKLLALSLCTITMTASLTACGGGGGSSSTPTTVPNSETVFYAHNVIFRNSTTVATGYNGFGQLGTGNLGNRVTAGVVKGGLTFTGVATGGNHTVAFMNNSTVHTWGSSKYGQLGNNTITYSAIPVRVVTTTDKTDVQPLRGVIAVTAGSRHSLALRNDGTVWAWGLDIYGQLGVPASNLTNDDIKSNRVALPVMVAGAPLKNIVAVAANGHFSLALDANGTVWAWGLNDSGQIGLPQSPPKAEPAPVSFPVPTTISAIAAGGATSYAIDTAGNLWSWGNNFRGQLGDGTTTDNFVPFLVTGLPDKVIQVAGGLQHVLARLADGTVWAWGYNLLGQLGDNNKKIDNNKPYISTPVQVVADDAGTLFSGATDIRAFGDSSMAKKGGKWYVWGDNAYGQLGTGGKGKVLIPVAMSGF